MIAISSVAKLLVLTILILGTTTAVKAQDDAIGLFDKAQALHEKGDLAGAIDLYRQAVEALPEFPEAEYQRAAAYLALGKRAEAENGFRRAIELRADWTLAQSALGGLLVSAGKYAEAEPLLVKAVDADPQNSSAVIALAELRLRSGAPAAQLQDVLRLLTNLSVRRITRWVFGMQRRLWKRRSATRETHMPA